VQIKVLVINRTHRTEQLAKDALQPLGCQIITATSTALGIFLARKNFPSLIIAGLSESDDYHDLPGEVKDDPDLAHIPVVLIAETAMDQTSPGADKYLRLPLDHEQLIAELRPYLVTSLDYRPEETSE